MLLLDYVTGTHCPKIKAFAQSDHHVSKPIFGAFGFFSAKNRKHWKLNDRNKWTCNVHSLLRVTTKPANHYACYKEKFLKAF
jgi:hypothetical protein